MHPIHRVLSTLRSNAARHLLMGGQACVLYGAAEFSRDTDICVLADAQNLDRRRAALADLGAAYWRPLRRELEQLRLRRSR